MRLRTGFCGVVTVVSIDGATFSVCTWRFTIDDTAKPPEYVNKVDKPSEPIKNQLDFFVDIKLICSPKN